MTEKQILYRLVGDVERLKSETDNAARSRRMTRRRVEETQSMVGEMSRKLDRIIDQHEAEAKRMEVINVRVNDVESGVEDYRRDRTRVLSFSAGTGLGTGGIAGFVGHWLYKVFGGS